MVIEEIKRNKQTTFFSFCFPLIVFFIFIFGDYNKPKIDEFEGDCTGKLK